MRQLCGTCKHLTTSNKDMLIGRLTNKQIYFICNLQPKTLSKCKIV